MQKTTPLFPEFHLQTLRRKRRTPQQKLADHLAQIESKTLIEMDRLMGRFVPAAAFKPTEAGAHSRQRIFTSHNTFWGFMSQVLSTDGGCLEVVRKIQAAASCKKRSLPSSSTSAYCQARKKLAMSTLHETLLYTSRQADLISSEQEMFNRRTVVVDGTGFSMPDTPENQSVWPQSREQKPGCGFPIAKVAALFSLHTGALLSYACGNKHDQEINLFRSQWNHLKDGDILLGDKGFNNFRDVAILRNKGVDTLMNLRRRPFKSTEIIRSLGHDDWLVRWKRPQRIKGYSEEEWQALPSSTVVRMIRIQVDVPGFRSQEIYLVTTLNDAGKYPAEALRDLYLRRWDVELFYRDIKETMGMDVLRCKTPEMITKELMMYMIAYNCIRCLMVEAAEEARQPLRRISFKGSLQALRSWDPYLFGRLKTRRDRFRAISDLYHCMTDRLVPDRPMRSEPRAVKRRSKNHRLMTKPRHEMVVPKHRNRNWDNKCKSALT